ncbi:outer membrane beta-barrel family protein [Yeosuana sp. MJ-SS3]|uniref:Outer membrane beta-barrel family protein n=1 Tax=Gilvirhabdus luticola TaxID=3079858 RepID=A0ABU3U9I9_9FLAO|nr:outer membrane beta-barrel family protein [Yeosuana sp. MJ-SS3]MDU8887079.1 outer membrane beta-barrel family protein [Yeosuana sp. MJ-SS3]
MKTLFKLFVLVSISLTSLKAFTSEAKWTISGTVEEQQTKKTVAYATVALYSKKDATLITGVITNDEGIFLLDKVSEGDYYLTVSFMGYKDYTVETIVLKANERHIDLGTILLEHNLEALDEVVVTSKTKAIKHAVDKQVLSVSSNLLATGGTAVDALRLSPSIQIDSDNNVKLRGSTNFIILINGKPTTLSAQDVLKQTSANTIKNIEVITNPSVKYNAEGGAGIINIILKKGVVSGFNGIVNASVGTKDKYAGDVNINLNKEKVSYSFGTEWRDYSKTANNNYYRTLYNEDNTHFATMLQDRKFTESNLGFRFGLDYNPNEKTNLSYSFHTGYNKIDGQVLTNNSGYTVPESSEEHKYNPFYTTIKPTFFTNNLGLTRTLNESNDILSFNLYYSYIDYDFNNSQASYLTDENQIIIDPEPYRLDISNRNNSNDVRFDADYTNVVSEQSNLETGVSYHQYNRFLNFTYSEYDYDQNDWVNHPDYTGKYKFNEGVYAAYLNLNSSFWGLSTSFGLRMEYTDRVLRSKNTDDEYKYHKANFFPGVFLSKNLNDNANVKFALTNRINRPDEYYMNPYPEFQDDYFYSEGNPYLIPEIIRNYEFGYSYSKNQTSFAANLYYRTTKNKIEQKLTVEDDDKIHTIFHNDSGDKSIGTELMYNFNFNDWWSVNANTSLFYYDIWANIDGTKSSNNDFSWTSQVVNSVNLNNTSSLQVISYYASKTARSQGELSNYFFMDIALKKQFLDGKLSVNLQLKDVLQSLNYELYTNTANMNLVGDFNNESPILLLNVSYKLSNYKKKTKDVETEFDM